MNYFQALKEWNKGKGIYCSPKKGTKEHAEVLAIQKGGSANAPATSSPATSRKTKKTSTRLPDLPQMTPAPAKSSPPKPPSATAVKMRKTRKTGSSVKLAVPKANKETGDENWVDVGMKMKRKKKVKVAIPIADRPLPTTQFSSRATPIIQFSKRAETEPITMFSSRGGVLNMPITQNSASVNAGNVGIDKIGAVEGILGKEAGKMINMAVKGKLARKRMAEAEKQMLFDIFLQ
jgi:hypothetical protein